MTWTCDSCTLVNTSGTKCSACNTAKPNGITIRFRTPALIFSTQISLTMKFGDLKDMLEGKSAIPAAFMRLTWGFPEKEAVGENKDLVTRVFGLKAGNDTITVHVNEIEGASETKSSGKKKGGAPGGAPTGDDGEDWGDDGGDTVDESAFNDDGGAGDWGDDGGDEFDDGEEVEVKKQVAAPPPLVRQTSFTVLSADALTRMQQELIDEIDETLGVSFHEAGVLMRKYRWKKERLFSDWVTDSAKVRREAGLKAKTEEVKKLVGTVSCPYCMSDVDDAGSIALACGHRFCLPCWSNWLNAEMDKGPSAVFTNCPEYQCQELVPEDIFLRLVDPAKKRLLQGWLVRNFIDGMAGVKWCPAPGCERAIAYPDGGEREIDCSCGARWCFKCRDDAHAPAPCENVAAWNAKNKSDKDNMDWILANTKMCPKCKTPIEKNNGCNHMTCRNCKHEFCWLCKGDWSQHGSNTGGYYKCNTYEAAKDKGTFDKETKDQEDAKNKLQKYAFYFQRYQDHDRAAKFAEKTIQQTEAKMEVLHERNGGDIKQVDFLLDAVKTVIQCRRALKWSYAMGFYLEDGSKQKRLFEQDQGMLEKFSDHLHELVEKPVETLLGETARKEVASYTAATRKYLSNINDAVMAGSYTSEGSGIAPTGKAAPPPLVAKGPAKAAGAKAKAAPKAKTGR